MFVFANLYCSKSVLMVVGYIKSLRERMNIFRHKAKLIAPHFSMHPINEKKVLKENLNDAKFKSRTAIKIPPYFVYIHEGYRG